MSTSITGKTNFIWKIADLLRGDYKQSEYGDVILPFTVLYRLDSVLAPTKDAVLEVNETCKFKNKAPFLMKATKTEHVPEGYRFYNVSKFTFAKLKDDAGNITDNLTDYIKGFSENARTILESFDIYSQIARLDRANLLYLIVNKFVDDIDLHPDRVKNNEMGYIFEELIRKFSEMSNETAGEHFTPREVIRLMVSMLFDPDLDRIIDPAFMAKLYDPAAGTGGMLSAAIEYADEHSYVWIVTNRKKGLRKGKIQLIDGTSFFERMRKPLGEKRKMLNDTHINDLTQIYGKFVDGEFCKIFDEDDFAYWKVTVERPLRLNFQATPERIERLREQTAFANLAKSRKRKPEEIVKEEAEGKKQQDEILAAVSTMDGSVLYKNRAEFTKLLQKAIKKAGFDVKPPLMKAILAGLSEKDETADICTDAKGNPEADTDLRDTEQIPFIRSVSEKEAIDAYIEREVKPCAPDAWVDYSKTKIGYEIPFTRHFYKYVELGNAEETLLEIQLLGERIQSGIIKLFAEV